MNILIFRNPTTRKIFLRVYQGYEPAERYDQPLTERESNGGKVIPDFLLIPASDANSFILDDAGDEAEIQKLKDLNRKLKDAELQKQQIEQDSIPLSPKAVTARTQQIEEQKKVIADLQKRLAGNRILEADEHRSVLIDGVTNAKRFIFIISPWISQDGTDPELVGLFRRAIQKGVWIVIGYGMPPRRNNNDRPAIIPAVEEEFKKIQKLKNGGRFIYQYWGSTHTKTLVCDNEFCVITSFNFLSYKGGQGFRDETGSYHVDPEYVRELLQRKLKRFKNLPEDFLKIVRES